MARVGDGMRSKWYKLMGGEQRKRLWVLKTTSQNSTGPKPKVKKYMRPRVVFVFVLLRAGPTVSCLFVCFSRVGGSNGDGLLVCVSLSTHPLSLVVVVAVRELVWAPCPNTQTYFIFACGCRDKEREAVLGRNGSRPIQTVLV